VALLPKLKTADGAVLDFPKLKVGAAAEVVGPPKVGAAWLLSNEAVVVEVVVVAVAPKENKPVPATKVGPALPTTVVVPKLPAVVVLATVVGPKLNGFTAAVDAVLEAKAGGGAEVAAGNDPNVSGAAAGALVVVAGGE